MTDLPRGRIGGLDVARGVALLGMVAAHVGDDGTRAPDTSGWAWLTFANGRPSTLFAVLAGVSISLMLVRRAGGDWTAASRADVAHTRWRVATRGAVLIVVGSGLAAFDTPIAIILPNLGVMFLLSLIAFRWSTRTLAVAAAASLVLGTAVVRVVEGIAPAPAVLEWPLLDTLVGPYYPAVAWMAYVCAGMAIGRLALRTGRVQAWLAGAGVGLAAVAYGAGHALGRAGLGGADAGAWFDVTAHSYSAFEMAGNLGVAALVIGGAVAAEARAPRLLRPLAATGAMAFSLYVLQIVAIAAVGPEIVWVPSNVSLVVLAGALVVFACLWRQLAGQGPLERLMTRASTAVADAAVTARPPVPG